MTTSLTSYLPDEFFEKLKAIGARQNFDPRAALAVMLFESGVKPTSIHPTAPASGIFGKMFSTRDEAVAFSEQSAVDQLDAYEKYMSAYRNVPKPTAANLYQLNFLPASAIPGQANYRGTSDDTVLAASGGTGYGGREDSFYQSNTVLDRNHDGAITVGDLGQALLAVQASNKSKWAELTDRLGVGSNPADPYSSSSGGGSLGGVLLFLGILGGAVYLATRPPTPARKGARA